VVWSEFSTEKKFEWVQKWDLSKGDDRQMRRLMERENKKIRDDYKRDYNEAVRVSVPIFCKHIAAENPQQLALFLQHRDPRYKQHQAKLRSSRASSKKASGSSTPAVLPDKTVQTEKQKEEARLQAAADYEEQEWQRLHLEPTSEESDDDEAEEEGDGTGVRLDDGQGGEIFECVACGKTFLTEASWENHERSKKHKQAVWR
jgi:DnaJ family protein A protein 5